MKLIAYGISSLLASGAFFYYSCIVRYTENKELGLWLHIMFRYFIWVFIVLNSCQIWRTENSITNVGLIISFICTRNNKLLSLQDCRI